MRIQVSRRGRPAAKTRAKSERSKAVRSRSSATPWIAAAVAVGIPLAFDPGGYFVFLPIKWTLASVLVAAGIATVILERRPLVRSAAVGAWGVLLVIVVAASIFGIGGLTSWIGYPGRYLGVIAWVTFFGAFLLGSCISSGDSRALVVRAASVASILVSLYAVLQAAGVDPIQWSEQIDESRTRSTLGNAAFLGAYLALMVPLAGRLALSGAEPVRMRAVHAGAAVLGSIALLTTQSRGAWLGAIAGVMIVAALEFRRLRTAPRLSAAVLGASLLIVLLLATFSPFAPRIRSIADPSTGTGRGRLIQWERTLKMIAARPVLGWGAETYAFAFPRFIDSRFERSVGREVVPDRAHNVVLDLASATGALGVGAFLIVLGLVARAVARARERDAITVGLAGGCVAYLAQLQFSFPLADLDTIVWLFAGLLVASDGARTTVISRWWAIGPLVAAFVLAIWGTTDLAADRTLRRSLNAEASADFAEAQRLADRAAGLSPGRVQYLQAAARLHRRVGEVSGRVEDFVRGLETLDAARRMMPRDQELAMDEGDLLLSWGEIAGDRRRIERAANLYEDVLGGDPASSRAHLKVGVAYVQLDRGDDAEEAWLTAAALAPRSPGPLVNLGILYEQQGRDDEARMMLRKALMLDPKNTFAGDVLRRLGS